MPPGVFTSLHTRMPAAGGLLDVGLHSCPARRGMIAHLEVLPSALEARPELPCGRRVACAIRTRWALRTRYAQGQLMSDIYSCTCTGTAPPRPAAQYRQAGMAQSDWELTSQTTYRRGLKLWRLQVHASLRKAARHSSKRKGIRRALPRRLRHLRAAEGALLPRPGAHERACLAMVSCISASAVCCAGGVPLCHARGEQFLSVQTRQARRWCAGVWDGGLTPAPAAT